MKKKILIIIDNLKRGGGAEKVASDFTIQLSKEYEISVLTFEDIENRYPVRANYYSLQENIKLLPRIIKLLKIHLIQKFLKIYKVIKEISPEIIVSFMDLTNIISVFVKIIFRIKIPLIICVHTNPKKAYEKDLKFLNPLLSIFYSSKFTNRIITISKELQYILEKNYQIEKTKLKTIYNGIDLEKIKELSKELIEDNQKIFENKNLIKFITVGRLVESKAQNVLIESFSIVKNFVPNSKLIIIGKGPLKKDLKKLIKSKGLNNDILLLGFKKNPFKYIANSDIFILSSKFEGLPMVLLEALACEVPIISTNCSTGPEEILDNNKYGFLVNVMDSKDMAEKMVFLAKNPKIREEYSKKSAVRAQLFDYKKIREKWIDLIESLIEK
jgi:glycosyltransferase involved in cell wall biosynthesis